MKTTCIKEPIIHTKKILFLQMRQIYALARRAE